MIGVFVLGVEETVGCNHVVHYVRLADFLGTELLRCRQVTAVVVAKVVVGDNRGGFDSRAHLPIDKRKKIMAVQVCGLMFPSYIRKRGSERREPGDQESK